MMREPLRRCCAGLLLLGGVSSSGCTTGHQFSIAMTNPGSAQTVLAVGDVGPGVEGAAPGGVTLPSSAAASSIGASGSLEAGQAAATRSQAPATLAILASSAKASATSPLVVAQAGPVPATQGLAPTSVQPTTVTPAVQAVVATSPVQVTVTTPVAQASVSTPTASIVVTTPVAQVAVPSPTVQVAVTTPVAQASVSTPTASIAVTTPVAQAAVPIPAVQVAVTSPAVTLVKGAIASSAAPLQATLAGVGSAVTLAAPSPGATPPVAALLKTLTSGPAKKLRHG